MSAKKTASRFAFALLLPVLLFSLTGCIAAFDHAAYVKSLLDASYKAEFDEYLVLTGSTLEEAQSQYNENMESVVNDIGGALAVDISDEHRARLRSIIEAVFKSASYEVAGAEKVSSKLYEVEMKILPIMNFKELEQPLSDFAAEFIERLYASDSESLNPDEVYGMFFDELVTVIDDGMRTINYGAEKSVKTPVEYNPEQKRWFISGEEQEKIFKTIIEL